MVGNTSWERGNGKKGKEGEPCGMGNIKRWKREGRWEKEWKWKERERKMREGLGIEG